jgi:hypothetical protein
MTGHHAKRRSPRGPLSVPNGAPCQRAPCQPFAPRTRVVVSSAVAVQWVLSHARRVRWVPMATDGTRATDVEGSPVPSSELRSRVRRPPTCSSNFQARSRSGPIGRGGQATGTAKADPPPQ